MNILNDRTLAGDRSQREHYWDTLRAFVMLLGIPYHTALSYRPGQTWIVRSDEGVEAFVWLTQLIHLFRMPAFFLIAGYFAALLLTRRDPGTWLKGRFLRLGVPFVSTIVTLVPLMNLACEFSNLPYSTALSSFIHNSSHSGGYWVRHLWFIIVLLYCCTVAAALVRRFPKLRMGLIPARLDAWMARNFAGAMLLVAALLGLWQALMVESFYIAGLNTMVLQQIFRLDELIVYAPWFALGCLLQRSPLTQQRMGRFSATLGAVALVAVALSLTVRAEVHPATGRFIATFAALAVTQALIATARTLFDRPHPLIKEVTDASFVIYLFHMPIIVVLVWLAQGVPMPTALKATAIMALSLALSWGAWRLIARSPALSFPFNGIRGPAPLHRSPA